MTREEQLTDHQYDTPRLLVDGKQPRHVNPATRRVLRQRGYITVAREQLPTHVRFVLAITDAGRTALATLPRLRPSIPKGLM